MHHLLGRLLRTRRRRTVVVAVLIVGGLLWMPSGETGTDRPRPTGAVEDPTAAAAEPVTGAAGEGGQAQDGAVPRATPSADADEPSWTITRVVDGDTVGVRATDGAEERVRLVGIDAPERGSCGHEEASSALAALLEGRAVDLVPGAQDDRDRHGRLLRYVEVDGEDAGLALLEQGLAVARYDSRDGYGRHRREDAYVAADERRATAPCGTGRAPSPARPDPGPASASSSSPRGPGTGPAGSWRSCAEARDHGAAPVRAGDLGYGRHLDGDDDGIGCEQG